MDSDAAVCAPTGAGVGAGTGADVGFLVFFVRFPLTTAQTRQRERCGRIISNKGAEMTRLGSQFSTVCSWQSQHEIFGSGCVPGKCR